MKWICLPQTLRVPYIFDLSELWYNPDSERLVLVGSSALVLVEKANLFQCQVPGTPRLWTESVSRENVDGKTSFSVRLPPYSIQTVVVGVKK